jgi:hypothetical protein
MQPLPTKNISFKRRLIREPEEEIEDEFEQQVEVSCETRKQEFDKKTAL